MVVSAAQYLRVSTEHQHYSLQHQRDVIERYASQRGFEIVATYSDIGRSGVLLRNRPELIRLLHDIVEGNSSYKAVLVYDVSRWGRFQDCDEAAHYEFICRSAGAPVHYCAEGFKNDSSLPDAIFKALQRTMAAEYSREMGARCLGAARRMVHLGFKQGGRPGYGLRRLMVSADGKNKRVLENGELKAVRTDRVILIPGPEEEIQCVREMYRLLIEENRTPYFITRELNRRGVKCPQGKWRVETVCRILSDPKYAGHNVWNRTTGRLGQRRVPVPRSNWIIRPDVFEPVISFERFCQAQQVLAEQKRPFIDEELLQGLRQLRAVNGALSYAGVKNCPDLPSLNTFIKRFGTLRHAFELAGQQYPWTIAARESKEQTRRLHQELIDRLQQLFPTALTAVRRDSADGEFLRLDDRVTVAVLVCPVLRRNGCLTWLADSRYSERKNLFLVARLNADNTGFRDFFVLPAAPRHWIRHRGELQKGKRLCDLQDFGLVARAVAASGCPT